MISATARWQEVLALYSNGMKKINILIITLLVLSFSYVSAQTKPAPGTDIDSLSYVFYLYYSNGQLFGDRDYEVKYDVVSEKFTDENVVAPSYKGEIVNAKFEVVKTFQFDPQKGNPSFTAGKITVRGPYVPNGFRANFFDPTGTPVLAIFVSDSSICDGDGFCNAQLGEDNKTCPADCQTVRISPSPNTTPLPTVDEGFNLFGLDLMQILTYVVGSLGVGVLAWFGWKWWKKRKEGDFPLPPPVMPQPPSSILR